jgi:hypothetical protein
MSPLQPLSQPDHLTVAAARQFLNQFICLKTMPNLTADEKAQVIRALRFLVDQSDFQTYGVCADTVDSGLQALKDYLAGLGHDVDADPSKTENADGAVYIKYNLRNGQCYLDGYPGTARGVLVTCHGCEDEAANGTYGHLPLDLFQA